MSDDDEGVKAFGASFQGFLRNMANQSPTEEPPVVRWVREHLGVDPAELVVVSATLVGASSVAIRLSPVAVTV